MTLQVRSAEGEKLTLFCSASSPFSNHHSSPFVQNSEEDPELREFLCVQHYFAYNKALTFGDKETAKRILEEVVPARMKAIGRTVRNFDKTVWDLVSSSIMKRGLIAKFSSNKKLRRALFLTHNSRIAEAEPTNIIWSIGRSMEDPRSRDPKLWRGKNLLGKLLEVVRDELWEDPRFRVEARRIERLIQADPNTDFFKQPLN